MMYFWLIPLLLVVALTVAYLFRGTKRTRVGSSRLDKALEEEREARGDLRE